MTITREIDGTLKMYQGDTGGFLYEDVPTDKNYFVFCQILEVFETNQKEKKSIKFMF